MFRMRYGFFLLCFLILCPVGVSAAEENIGVDLSPLEEAVESLEDTLDGTISLSDLLTDMLHGDF